MQGVAGRSGAGRSAKSVFLGGCRSRRACSLCFSSTLPCSEVWLATWLGSPVAVKTIVPELQNKEKLVKRFIDEILLMRFVCGGGHQQQSGWLTQSILLAVYIRLLACFLLDSSASCPTACCTIQMWCCS